MGMVKTPAPKYLCPMCQKGWVKLTKFERVCLGKCDSCETGFEAGDMEEMEFLLTGNTPATS